MSVTGWLAVGGSAIIAVLGAVIWWLERQYTSAASTRNQALADLSTAQKAAEDAKLRSTAAGAGEDRAFTNYQIAVEALVAAHPDLAGEYRTLVLRLIAAASTRAAAVPSTPAPVSPPPRNP